MIYFIQAGNDGFIKIGSSNNVEERKKQLQTGCPDELKILFQYGGILGNEYPECDLHGYFKEFRVRGEWFYPSENSLQVDRDLF